MPWKNAPGVARSRTDHRSIRGHISGPIPIRVPDSCHDTPPELDPASTLAVPRRVNDVADCARANRRKRSSGLHQHLVGISSVDASYAPSQFLDNSQEASGLLATKRPPPGHSDSHARADGKPTETATADKPLRKKSTLRSALGRLLGRSRKSVVASPNELLVKVASSDASARHNRSDPGVEKQAAKTADWARSASLPITEYDRALRSHSIGPEDVLAIRSARNSLTTDLKTSTKAGSAEVSSACPTATPRWTETRLAGLSPRPASSHDRRPRLADWSEDPNEIGRAITSDAKGMIKRRSRSLSAFPSAEDAFHPLSRRRSDEVCNWRDSCAPGARSVMSSMSSSAHELDSAAVVTVNEPEETAVENSSQMTPIQPFIFEHVASTKEAVSLKITQVISLNSRISGLEVRMSRLEQLVAGLVKSVPGFTPAADLTWTPPSSGPDDGQHAHLATDRADGGQDTGLACAPSRHSDTSKMALGDDAAICSDAATQVKVHRLDCKSNATRPLSFATLCSLSGPTVPEDLNELMTVDHYLTLLTLLETERSSREMLELQVQRLSHQAGLGHAPYTQDDASSARGSLGGASNLNHDSEDDQGLHMNGDAGHDCCASKLKLDPVTAVGDVEDDGAYPESFTTPNEHQAPWADREDHGTASRTAARTISLSRLTMLDSRPSACRLPA